MLCVEDEGDILPTFAPHARLAFDELLANIYEAVEGCLAVDLKDVPVTAKDKVLEIAV